jgi:MotA/TolQ/ExbB proton channel family protein
VAITNPQVLPQNRWRCADDGLSPQSVADLSEVVRRRFAEPAAAEALGAATHEQSAGNQVAFLSRFVVVQAIGAAALIGLWMADLAGKPFEGSNAPLCWLIVAMGALGIACVFLRRWQDVQWIATHVVRIGLLGTVIGLIIAFAAAGNGASADAEQVKTMIAAVVSGMYVSLYATLLGIGTNLWLKINLRLLGDIHG